MATYKLSRLPNGLKVVTVPMRDRESVSVAIWVRAGARYENAKNSGVSHFLEHMLFKGTRKRTTREIKEEIEGVGGMLNAFTGEEATCYFAKLLKEHYPKALDVLADIVKNATLEAAEIEKERNVILEEIRMYRDHPSHQVHDLVGEVLWPGHALGRQVSGTEATVKNLTRKEIITYKKKYYHPRNLVVAVAGSVDHEDVMKYVRRAFPKTGGARRASIINKINYRQARSRARFLEKTAEQTHFVIGFHTFSRYHPDRHKLGLLNTVLGGNMSSRLFEEVREKRGLAYEIRSGLTFFQDTGCLAVSAGVETAKASHAIAVVLEELERLSRSRISAGELRRAKDYFMSQLYMAIEDTLDHMLWVSERALYSDQLPNRRRLKEKIENVKASDIQKLAAGIFCSSNINLALVGPVPVKIQQRIEKGLRFKRS